MATVLDRLHFINRGISPLELVAEEVCLPRRARWWSIHPPRGRDAPAAARRVPDPVGRPLFGEDLWD